jgi:hypothetical protein
MNELTEQELIRRLKDTEDGFVERKTVGDTNDCLKTVVAFANSTPVGFPAVLFVGVRDNGEVENTDTDFDQLQKNLSKKLASAYPPVYTTTKILRAGDREFMAIVVPGSEGRPHFAGQAYIRDGSQSLVASQQQFEKLIALRSGKPYEILKWKGKGVTLTQIARTHMLHGSTQWSYAKHMLVNVADCNLHYVTLGSVHDITQFVSYPLSIIELNYDDPRRRLELRLLDGSLPSWPVSI